LLLLIKKVLLIILLELLRAASAGTDPSVTLTTGTNIVLVMVSATELTVQETLIFVDLKISGATTLAANDAYSANVGGVSAYIQSS
jgi:hypothetical protein